MVQLEGPAEEGTCDCGGLLFVSVGGEPVESPPDHLWLICGGVSAALVLGMAEVGTFLQLVSWFGGSWGSLALHHDLTWGGFLGQRILPLGFEILLYPSLGLQIRVVDRGCEQWCDCLLGQASPQQASQGRRAGPLGLYMCICTGAVD